MLDEAASGQDTDESVVLLDIAEAIAAATAEAR